MANPDLIDARVWYEDGYVSQKAVLEEGTIRLPMAGNGEHPILVEITLAREPEPRFVMNCPKHGKAHVEARPGSVIKLCCMKGGVRADTTQEQSGEQA